MSGEREAALEEAAAMLDSWAQADEHTNDDDEAGTLRCAAACIRGLKDSARAKRCLCPGCPKQVPTYWRAGVCLDCGNEDCEHDDELEDEP